MAETRDGLKQTLVTIGVGSLALAGLAWLLSTLERGPLAQGRASPSRPVADPEGSRLFPAKRFSGPVQIAGPVDLRAGRRYVAAIRVAMPLSLVANVRKVEAQARSMGFTDARVTKTPPPGAPPIAKGDYYVESTYAGEPTVAERSHAGGSVQVVDVWRVA